MLLAYIFTAPICTRRLLPLEPCALNPEFWGISYSDSVKFHYFADTTEKTLQGGVRGGGKTSLEVAICIRIEGDHYESYTSFECSLEICIYSAQHFPVGFFFIGEFLHFLNLKI
jgi:hypothetical protein